jgi:CBS domain containing-hemolysin-like protein
VSVSVVAGVLALILANALYVSAEFGAVGVRRSRVRRMADDGSPLARRLLPFVDNSAALVRYVSASQIGITLSSLTLGAFAQATFGLALAPLLATWFKLDQAVADSTSAIVVLAALTAVQVVLGELVPKYTALQYPTQVALATVLPMQWSLRLFRPFTALLNLTAAVVLRLLGAKASTHRHIHSPDEIELLIAESRDGGLLEPEEQERLHRALQLGLRSARDLMVPLARLTMLAIDTPWDEIVRTVAGSPFSRLPVFRGSRDRIVGTLRVKDLVDRFIAEGQLPLDRLIRPVVELSESLPADRVVGLLRERRVHQAVVVDAAGHAIGVITIQDVLSELLGSATPATARSGDERH